jgi:hypothetical protein
MRGLRPLQNAIAGEISVAGMGARGLTATAVMPEFCSEKMPPVLPVPPLPPLPVPLLRPSTPVAPATPSPPNGTR